MFGAGAGVVTALRTVAAALRAASRTASARVSAWLSPVEAQLTPPLPSPSTCATVSAAPSRRTVTSRDVVAIGEVRVSVHSQDGDGTRVDTLGAVDDPDAGPRELDAERGCDPRIYFV